MTRSPLRGNRKRPLPNFAFNGSIISNKVWKEPRAESGRQRYFGFRRLPRVSQPLN